MNKAAPLEDISYGQQCPTVAMNIQNYFNILNDYQKIKSDLFNPTFSSCSEVLTRLGSEFLKTQDFQILRFFEYIDLIFHSSPFIF